MEFHLRAMFRAAVESAMPARVLPPLLEGVSGPVWLTGAGKASAGMAAAAAPMLDIRQGAVVTLRDAPVPGDIAGIDVMFASHPLPDESSREAAERMLGIARAAAAVPGATLICLLSGGGSALMSLPPSGVTGAVKAGLIRDMLAAGSPIQDINCVRRHLSRIKGGRLAAAAFPARVMTFAISDVVGDAPADIASGPSVPDPTSLAQAAHALARSGIRPHRALIEALSGPDAETPFPGDSRIGDCRFFLAASGSTALAAAAAVAPLPDVVNLGAGIIGDSRAAAAEHARLVLELRSTGRRCVILSGGETTTVIRGPGRGGSNTEFLLALAAELQGVRDIWAIAADTDGIDGRGGHAGAWFGPDLVMEPGLADKAAEFLAQSDSGSFFDQAGLLVRTGPTGTNVNDFRAIIVG
ncbi:MAG TPA: DUF4147 domain-containing protein [Myxococcota bacterium]|nr:DUF4147 domain-containing protein [Myxococcota bacterium]HPV03323.1 DUF4147 domain-containing protein [Myxococcota bacterium]